MLRPLCRTARAQPRPTPVIYSLPMAPPRQPIRRRRGTTQPRPMPGSSSLRETGCAGSTARMGTLRRSYGPPSFTGETTWPPCRIGGCDSSCSHGICSPTRRRTRRGRWTAVGQSYHRQCSSGIATTAHRTRQPRLMAASPRACPYHSMKGSNRVISVDVTVKQLLLCDLPGYTPVGAPAAAPSLTLAALDARFHDWLLDEYHQCPHSDRPAPRRGT